MKMHMVKFAGKSYMVFAASHEEAVSLIRAKFKIDWRRAAWARAVRPYKFK